jgi:hypothetical protein
MHAPPRLWLKHALLGLGAVFVLCVVPMIADPKGASKLLLSAVVIGPVTGLVLHWLRQGPCTGALVFGLLYFGWSYAASAWDLPFPGMIYVGVFMFPCIGVILGFLIEQSSRRHSGFG